VRVAPQACAGPDAPHRSGASTAPGRSFGAPARLKHALGPSASPRTPFRRASVLVAAVCDVEMGGVQTADKAHQLAASIVSAANSMAKTIHIPRTRRPSSSRPRSGPGSATPSSSTVRDCARLSRAPAHTRAPAVTHGNHSVTQSTFAAPCVPAHLANVTMNGFDSGMRAAVNGTAGIILSVPITPDLANTKTLWGFQCNAIRLDGTAPTSSHSASHLTSTSGGSGASSCPTARIAQTPRPARACSAPLAARGMLDVVAAVAETGLEELEPGPANGMQLRYLAGSAPNGTEQVRNDTEKAPDGHAVDGDSDDEGEDVLLPRARAPSQSSWRNRKWLSALVSTPCVIVTQYICFICITQGEQAGEENREMAPVGCIQPLTSS
jgi:hypothetical protein